MPTGGGQTCWISCSKDLLGREFSREVFGTLPLKLKGNKAASQVSTWICSSRSLSRVLGGWVGRGAGLGMPHRGQPCFSSLLVNGVSPSTPRCCRVWAKWQPFCGPDVPVHKTGGWIASPAKPGIAQPLQPASCPGPLSWGLQETFFSPLSTWAVDVHTGNLWGVRWRAKRWHQIQHCLWSSVVTGFPCLSSALPTALVGRRYCSFFWMVKFGNGYPLQHSCLEDSTDREA